MGESDLRALKRQGSPIAPWLRPLLAGSELEAEVLVQAIGGERASPQRIVLVRDAGSCGWMARALMARFAETLDPELATRVGTLLAARRAALVAAGLDEVRVEHDLRAYLEERSERSADPDAAPGPEQVDLVARHDAARAAAPEADAASAFANAGAPGAEVAPIANVEPDEAERATEPDPEPGDGAQELEQPTAPPAPPASDDWADLWPAVDGRGPVDVEGEDETGDAAAPAEEASDGE